MADVADVMSRISFAVLDVSCQDEHSCIYLWLSHVYSKESWLAKGSAEERVRCEAGNGSEGPTFQLKLSLAFRNEAVYVSHILSPRL